MTFSLTVEPRDAKSKAAALRDAGRIPGVLYGPKEQPTSFSVERSAFEKLLKEAGESSIVTLEGLGTPKDVLVHDVAFDATRGGAIHVDFYAIEAGKEITLDVPFEFIGESAAVKQGGVLTKVLYEIEVTCAPANLPKHITVDVSALSELGAQIHVKDLVIPTGVTIENNPEDVVVLVQAVEEEAEVAPAEIDMGAIEVEKKGKTEDADAA